MPPAERFRLSRRGFLGGVGAALALTACSDAGEVAEPGRDAPAPEAPPEADPTTTTAPTTTTTEPPPPPPLPVPLDQRTLVVVEFGGGNDILNTVVPHSNGRYYDLRPSLAIQDPIDLDGEIGLHPALTVLEEEWQADRVALVEGVGIEKPSLSHFKSMQRWWEATDTPNDTGWLGRYIDATSGFDDLLAGVTVGASPTLAMAGNNSYVVNVATALGLAAEMPWWIQDRGALLDNWAKFVPEGASAQELTAVEKAISRTAAADRELAAGLNPLRQAMEADGSIHEQIYTLVGQMRLAAGLIVGGIAPRVIYVHGLVDFDTHSKQGSVHDQLMYEFNDGLRYFRDALAEAGMTDRAVVMTTSEFGRRPAESGNGTDHGTASSQLLIGGLVAPGRQGQPHDLSRLDDDGNLFHSVDFRSVFASVLDRWLEVDPAEILGRNYETLPLFV